jgi:hypothetical protein
MSDANEIQATAAEGDRMEANDGGGGLWWTKPK